MDIANSRGMALIPTLTISLVALLLGFAAMYISEMGYRSISAEARWQMLEKVATGQAKVFANKIINGTEQCGTTTSGNLNGVNFNIVSIGAGGSCFIWSSATVGSSRVTKVTILSLYSSTPLEPPADYGAAVFRDLKNFSLSGSASITSCDSQCQTSALITGNSLSNLHPEDQVSSCQNNPKGITALVDPYVVNADLREKDLTEVFFKDLKNRVQMLDRFSDEFKVIFSNGTPVGVKNPDCIPGFNVNNCTASGSKITCDNEQIDLTWNGSFYVGKIGNAGVSCWSIDFGQNAKVTFQGFTGGGTVGANEIEFSGNVYGQDLTVIARNNIYDNQDGIKISNVNMFAQNYDFNDNRLVIEGGIIYSGGAGNGNLNLNLNSNSQIGTSTNPTLIISDNNINIQRNGDASMNGVVFVTSENNNFSIGSGNGNFAINGMVMSNSLKNNNGSISGNFSINFNRGIILKLAERYTFVNQPKCGSSTGTGNNTNTYRYNLIQTMTTVY